MEMITPALLVGLVLISHGVDAYGISSKLSSFQCPKVSGEHIYADVSTGCRVYYWCIFPRSYRLQCPSTLIFNEKKGVCDHPHRVECKSSSGALRVTNITTKWFSTKNIPLNSRIAPDSLRELVKINKNSPTEGSTSLRQDTPSDPNTSFTTIPTRVSTPFRSELSTESSKNEGTEPSHVDENLFEMLGKSTGDLMKSGNHESLFVDDYNLPPGSDVKRNDKSEEMLSSKETLDHIMNHQESESEEEEEIRVSQENFDRVFELMEPIVSVVVSNGEMLHNVKRALISAFFELKPIVDELIHSKASRTKRSVEEPTTASATSETDLPDRVPPVLHGSESEMSNIEKTTARQFGNMKENLKSFFLALLFPDKEFATGVTDELERIVEQDVLEEIPTERQLPSLHERRKRFVGIGDPIVISRSAIEQAKRGLRQNTLPIVKDVLKEILPDIFISLSKNVPLLMDSIGNMLSVLKDSSPALLQHTLDLVSKYMDYKFQSSSTHVILPPPMEILQAVLPYVFAVTDIGSKYINVSPVDAYNFLFDNRSGILRKMFDITYVPPTPIPHVLTAGGGTVPSAQDQRLKNNFKKIAARLAERREDLAGPHHKQ